MTDSYTFKKFSKTDFLEEIPDNATLLIEDGGDIKRVPASQVGGTDVQANLDQNDPEAPDYVKGRTHWVDLEEKTVELDCESENWQPLEGFQPFDGGDEIDVTVDGVAYSLVAFYDGSAPTIGDKEEDIFLGSGSYGWNINFYDQEVYFYSKSNHTVRYKTEVVHTIDEKYLPLNKGVGAQGSGFNAEVFNNCEDNVASGECSHAEGSGCTAAGDCDHAEGARNIASGGCSHVEGMDSKTTGRASHAEGICSNAASECQHVQGKYNIVDNDGKYAHIVGNGEYSKPSNAHTLDWSGNAWYKGTVECTAVIMKPSLYSTKRFRITVDDSGTISATEITE